MIVTTTHMLQLNSLRNPIDMISLLGTIVNHWRGPYIHYINDDP